MGSQSRDNENIEIRMIPETKMGTDIPTKVMIRIM
jgi:hypothetical protein